MINATVGKEGGKYFCKEGWGLNQQHADEVAELELTTQDFLKLNQEKETDYFKNKIAKLLKDRPFTKG